MMRGLASFLSLSRRSVAGAVVGRDPGFQNVVIVSVVFAL